MTQPIYLEHRATHGRGRLLVVAILSTVIILAVMAVVELGALAVLAVASSALNHHGLAS